MKCRSLSHQILRPAASALIAAICLVSQNASAAEIYQFYTGARQMAMGGAYTGIVNDETALLTNPAGLGKIRDTTYTLFDPEVDLGYADTDIGKLDNASKVSTVQGLLDALNGAKGKHWHFKGQVFPSIVGTNFGIGVHAKVQEDAQVSDDGTIFHLDYTKDVAFALGYCFRFFSGVVKLGTAVRLVDRTEVHKDLDATSTNLVLDNLTSEGLGVASDVGLIITAPVALLPQLSLVLRDAGNTTYTLSNGMFASTQTRPVDTMQSLDAGLSVFPIISNHNRMSITAEYHGILTASQELDPMKRVHAGVEFNIHDFFFVRGGMNQRYYTAGIELSTETFQLQVTTYGEEIGTNTAYKEDRRFIGKLAIRF